jgi:hypothetical protein
MSLHKELINNPTLLEEGFSDDESDSQNNIESLLDDKLEERLNEF